MEALLMISGTKRLRNAGNRSPSPLYVHMCTSTIFTILYGKYGRGLLLGWFITGCGQERLYSAQRKWRGGLFPSFQNPLLLLTAPVHIFRAPFLMHTSVIIGGSLIPFRICIDVRTWHEGGVGGVGGSVFSNRNGGGGEAKNQSEKERPAPRRGATHLRGGGEEGVITSRKKRKRKKWERESQKWKASVKVNFHQVWERVKGGVEDEWKERERKKSYISCLFSSSSIHPSAGWLLGGLTQSFFRPTTHKIFPFRILN